MAELELTLSCAIDVVSRKEIEAPLNARIDELLEANTRYLLRARAVEDLFFNREIGTYVGAAEVAFEEFTGLSYAKMDQQTKDSWFNVVAAMINYFRNEVAHT